jgi:hypothetical protein
MVTEISLRSILAATAPIARSPASIGVASHPLESASLLILAASALIFVEPTQSERARQALRRTLGAKRVEYLLALLVFIRAAHFWTAVHPGLEIEDDVRELMSTHKELPSLLLQDPDPEYR